MHGGGSVVGLGVTALLLLCAVPPSSSQSPLYPYVPYPSDLEGQLCGPPPNGYLPLPCGSRIIVGVVEEPLSPDDNGLVMHSQQGRAVLGEEQGLQKVGPLECSFIYLV